MLTVNAHLKVTMVTVSVPRMSYVAESLSLHNGITHVYRKTLVVCVKGRNTVSVVDDNAFSVAVAVVACLNDSFLQPKLPLEYRRTRAW